MSNKNLTATVAVNSSAIREVRYNYESSIFYITFVRGDEYKYPDVPEYVFNGFLNAPSKGRFLNKFIRNEFKTSKL
tara:strand:- start:132 stop:359 length:228 start_codon:yes stop_codon:yes gene_type:complete